MRRVVPEPCLVVKYYQQDVAKALPLLPRRKLLPTISPRREVLPHSAFVWSFRLEGALGWSLPCDGVLSAKEDRCFLKRRELHTGDVKEGSEKINGSNTI